MHILIAMLVKHVDFGIRVFSLALATSAHNEPCYECQYCSSTNTSNYASCNGTYWC